MKLKFKKLIVKALLFLLEAVTDGRMDPNEGAEIKEELIKYQNGEE